MTETYALLTCKSEEGQKRLERMLNRLFSSEFSITPVKEKGALLLKMKNGLSDQAILKASFPALAADNPDLDKGLFLPSPLPLFYNYLDLVPSQQILELFKVAKENPSVYYETYDLISGLDKEILETIQVYIENNCSPLLSSYALFVHKNTVTYRLNIFVKKTGITLNSFANQMFLYGLITSQANLQESE